MLADKQEHANGHASDLFNIIHIMRNQDVAQFSNAWFGQGTDARFGISAASRAVCEEQRARRRRRVRVILASHLQYKFYSAPLLRCRSLESWCATDLHVAIIVGATVSITLSVNELLTLVSMALGY